MNKGSILLQFIVSIAAVTIAIALPSEYEIIRLVVVFIPLLIFMNIIIQAATN